MEFTLSGLVTYSQSSPLMKILKRSSDATLADTAAKKRDMLEVARMVKRNSNTANMYYSSKVMGTRLTTHTIVFYL